MRRIVIARHGNTFAPSEPPRRIGRATDLPLVASGRAQALALRDHFAAERFDLVLSGPLLRTRETAELIAQAPVAIVEWLAEIDHGPDEGRREEEVVARIGEAALAAWDREGVAPPGWIVDADARTAAWHDFFAQQAVVGEGAALLVTSNGAARFALAALPDHGSRGSPRLRTGAYGEIALDPAPRLIGWDLRPGDQR